jgi:hypothetical protein
MMTFAGIASDLVDVFDDLEIDQIEKALIKNVPYERLEFFNQYAKQFGEAADIKDEASKRLANLMSIGYLLRVLEDQPLPDRSIEE